jgi:hypothetical protein
MITRRIRRKTRRLIVVQHRRLRIHRDDGFANVGAVESFLERFNSSGVLLIRGSC